MERKVMDTPGKPHRFGTGALVAVLVVGLAGGVGGSFAFGHHHGEAGPAQAGATAPAKERWVCPMHPTVVQDHPGDCPICGMKLVLQKPDANSGTTPAAPGAAAGAGVAKGERMIAFYRSPMDAKQTSPTPRKDEMGMDYLPVYEDEVNGGTAGGKVEGLAAVQIDPQRQQLIGLRTAAVTRGPVGESWRTVGRVAVDETRVHHVNVKVAGFADQVYADYVGKPVKAGEPLFTFYSPDLVSAEEEYLLALRTRKALARSETGNAGEDLVESARRRLELWDIPRAEIARIEKTGKVQRTLTMYAPMSGVVTRKDLVMGHRLAEGDMPFEITDLSEVWVLADAYESDLGRVKLGMGATLRLQAFPNRTFKGKVTFIDPVLDPATRTAKVRIAFANPTGELRPAMFGEVTFQTTPRQGLRVPADAVVNSGTRDVVFVALGDGKFAPRQVKLGAVNTEVAEVVSGLQAGEQVVTRANFLIDSESRLRASLASMAGGQ